MRLTPLALTIALIGIPGSLQAARPARASKHADGTVHKVRKGETAAKIARDSGLTLEQLAGLNPKIRLSKLSVGMALKVGEPHGSKQAKTREPEVEAQESKPQPLEALAPVPPLPATPSLAPATLVHLERLIPDSTNTAPPPISSNSSTAFAPPPLATMSRHMEPVLPPASGLEYESLVSAALGFDPADPSKLDLLWPVETRTVSSAWGPRIRTRSVRVKASTKKRVRVRYRGSHKGVDLTAPIGTDVYAALDGRVVTVGKHRQYGNYVILDHGNGVETRYAHHRVNLVHEGDIVHRGQKIAEVGRTGNATGPHLHFELRLEGAPQNPLPMLNDVEEIPAEVMALNSTVVVPPRRR